MKYWRVQEGFVPSQLALLPDRTQFLVADPPISRYPGEQEKVQCDPAAFRELVQEMLPWSGADREGEHVATTPGKKVSSYAGSSTYDGLK